MFAWIAFFFSALSYLHNDILIDFADEGFLWYGALQVMKGMAPIRDFQSYDPGRYYWCAAMMSVCCKGILSLRFAAGVFQFLSLCAGLSVVRRLHRSVWVLILSGLLMTLWMLLSFRYFDSGMALLALFFAVRLLEKPDLRRHLAAGVFTGVAAFFGMNHGLYILLGMGCLLLYRKLNTKWYLMGLAAGLAPFAAMAILLPGFAESYGQQLSRMAWAVSTGHTIASQPLIWPWQLSGKPIDLQFIHQFSAGCLMVGMPIYYILQVPQLIAAKKSGTGTHAVWVAAFFIGLFYMRHAFSYSNICYLGEGILPLGIGMFALTQMPAQKIMPRIAMGGVVLFSSLSLAAAGLIHPFVFKHMVDKNAMTWYSVGQDTLWLPKTDAQIIEEAKRLVTAHVKPEEPLLIAPLMTTLYAVLEKQSPVHELYFHMAAPPEKEEEAIRQLKAKNVRWALVAHVEIDGHPEQALPNSHPVLWQYLQSRFEVVPAKPLSSGYFLMRRKD